MIVCKGCEGWVEATADFEARTLRCTACGYEETVRFLPLFVVTGPSGTGKTEVLTHLRPLLPNFDIFETDLLWDSQSDWHFVRSNWLRIAFSIAQSGRATILCGTHLPEHLDLGDYRPFFPTIHYLALLCDEDTLTARLRARPAWRNCDEAFITRQQEFSRWLRDNAETAFSPPLTLVDATAITVQETAERICHWAMSRLL
jgi:hypothetical protein